MICENPCDPCTSFLETSKLMSLELVLFFVLSIPLLTYSWPSLRKRRAHGFYRFFAWEAILGLIIVNLHYWFADPFSPLHLLAWALLAASITLALHSFWLLRQVGKPQGEFENTTRLVTIGAYRYIRHPLYASLLCLAAGAWLKQVTLLTLALFAIAVIFLYATARVEERENLTRFGQEYADYMHQTKMFIPFVF
jgi:protein-S-isoprenylcysteine O-methyltransferase Ste14